MNSDPDAWAAAVEHITAGIVVQCRSGEIVHANAQAAHILGLTLDQLLGRSSFDPRWKAITEDGDPFPGEDHPAIKTLHTGESYTGVRMGVQLPNGDRRWIDIDTRPATPDPTDPRSAAVVCTFTEVTEAANSTKAIGDSERLFRQLAEFTNDLVCRIDQRGFVSYVSPSMERALGWADLHGSYLTQCIDPEYRSAYAQPITAIIRGETDAEQAEFDLLTSDGRRVTVDASLVGIDVWGRRGAQRTGAVVTMRDITERRALEAARHDAEVLFAQVFNNSPVGLALTSLISGEPLVVDCNPSYAELFGLEREELLGVNLLDFTHPDDWELSVSGRSELMSGDVDRNEVELRVIRRGGEVIWCSVKRSLARGRTGEPRYIIAQATDITQQRAQAEHIRSLALTDVLTGLPNRRLLLERLEHALARRERSLDPVAVLFLDLDHFKAVNDSLGHEAGDELLRDVGEALTESVRSSDTVARLGGDEFAVIIEALPEDDVRLIVERIARNLRFDRRLPDGAIVTVTASIGVAWASLGRDGAAVLRRADGAMYRAKQSGRNQTVYA